MRAPLRWAAVVLAAAAALSLSVVPAAQAAPSPADTQVIQAGLTITPSVTVVGTTVTVVATATNTSDTTAAGSMGIDNYADLKTTSISAVRCAPRNLIRTIYCGISLPAGATASITVTVAPATAGSYDFRSWGAGTEVTYAYGTLTVS